MQTGVELTIKKGKQKLKTAYQFYIVEGHYKTMDKDRMRHIIYEIKKTSITDEQNEKLNQVLKSL